jgi:hypothetical protein
MRCAIIHDQREIRSGAIGASATRGVRCYVSLPAHGERGVEYRSPDCFDAYFLPRSTGGGFGPRPFPIHVARAPLSVEPRQRVGAVLPPRTRLAATFNLCAALLIGRSHQLNRISDKPGSDLAYPSHAHNVPFRVTFQRPNRDIERIVNVQQVVGEIRNV